MIASARSLSPAMIDGEPHQLTGAVLLVEDDPVNRKVLATGLTRIGLATTFAENGRIAVELVESGQHFDAVLMDLQMPEMDGITATVCIRQHEKNLGKSPCPIIAVTANAYDEDRLRCREAGMNDLVPKPVIFTELTRVLGNWLPSVPVPQATACAADRILEPAQIARIGEVLADLLPQLDQQLFDALSFFSSLEDIVSGTPAARSVQEIRTDLDQLDFKSASTKLCRLAADQGWPLETNASVETC